jgi:hypothetical protein
LSKYYEDVSENLGLDDQNIWDLEFANTGRRIRGTEGYELANKWAQLLNRDDLIKHPAAEEFRSLISEAPRVISSIVCFRVRGITRESPTSRQMGPPPINCKTSGGRYNTPGEHVLYLSDSEDGVIREFKAQRMKGAPYIQRYNLPVDKLCLADLTKIPEDHFVCHVFSKAEECNVEGRGNPGYNFSQIIAEFVKVNFDGMRVPGVHGEPGQHYSNIIVFRPFPDWCNWLDPEATPYRYYLKN